MKVFECYLGKIALLESDTKQAQYLMNNNVYIGEDEVKECVKLIAKRDNPVMIDGGANHGLFSLSMKNKLSNLTVHAIEAQSKIYSLLKESVALNSLENYHVYNKALSDSSGSIEVPLYDYTKRISSGSVELLTKSEDVGQEPIGYESIDTITIDSLELNKIDFIKLDVEGMEVHALKGALNTIQKYKPFLFIEYKKCGKTVIDNFIKTNFKNIYDLKFQKADVICIPK